MRSARVPGSARPTALALLGILAAVAAPSPASAHPLDLGYLRVVAGGTRIAVELDLELGTAARLLDLPDPAADLALAAATLPSHAAALAAATLARAPITTAQGPCRWSEARAIRTGRTVSLRAEATCPPGPPGARAVRWALPFVAEPRVSTKFQLLVKIQGTTQEQVTTLDRRQPVLELGLDRSPGTLDFVRSGVEHIGATPAQWHDASGWLLPDGLDHIVFLLGLMLAGGSMLQLLGIASGFTLGHSITLAMSALGVVRPPPALIEPLIALSIAVVAAEAFFGAGSGHAGKRRWQLAAGFGLIHGFGFAGALGHLHLSLRETLPALFGYNLGVELGQITIVVLTAPLILLLQRNHRASALVVRALAVMIFVAGACWFVQRVLAR